VIRYDYVKTRREDVKPLPENYKGLIRAFIKTFTRINVWVYKLSGGRLLNKFPGGFDICIVGTTGAKSGKRREIALIHLPYGKAKLLVASQGGADTHPTWYHNVKAHPGIDIMFGAEKHAYRARQVSDDEKRDLWPHLLSIYPPFDEYQARTDRNIPVFLCERVD
jgi:deazaflavin-dependent oxidoreductase (nitroreductase family)